MMYLTHSVYFLIWVNCHYWTINWDQTEGLCEFPTFPDAHLFDPNVITVPKLDISGNTTSLVYPMPEVLQCIGTYPLGQPWQAFHPRVMELMWLRFSFLNRRGRCDPFTCLRRFLASSQIRIGHCAVAPDLFICSRSPAPILIGTGTSGCQFYYKYKILHWCHTTDTGWC